MTATAPELQPWWISARSIRDDVAECLERDDTDMALRLLIDGVNRIPEEADDAQLALLLEEPSSIGPVRWDTLLAALIRYRLHRIDRVPPRWTWKKPLDRFWWPVRINPSKGYNDMAHSPAELSRVGIFMDRRSLTSA